jgi:hypothetical protein
MINQVKEFKSAQPFEPFSIELSSGRILKVSTPDHLILAKRGVGRVVGLNDDGTFSTVWGSTLRGWGSPEPLLEGRK